MRARGPTVRVPAGYTEDLGIGIAAADLEKFLAQPRVAVFGWTARNGEITTAPMWFVFRDGLFLLHTGHPSPKTEAILRNDRVVLTIHDDVPPYRYVTARGRARLRRDPEAALKLYREQARTYYGRVTGALYLRRVLSMFTAEHVIIEVTPEKLVGFDANAAVHPLLLVALRAARKIGL
jgi:general stress protein 26